MDLISMGEDIDPDGPDQGRLRRSLEDGTVGDALYEIDTAFSERTDPVRFELAQDTYAELLERGGLPDTPSKLTLYTDEELDDLQEPEGSPFDAFDDDDAAVYRLVAEDLTLRVVPDERHRESAVIGTEYDSIEVAVPTRTAYAEDVQEKLGGPDATEYWQDRS